MKVERVYREILFRGIEKGESEFVQRRLAESCEVSIGLVNFALRPLRRMGAVVVKRRSLELLDPWKVLLYWCSIRNTQREVEYSSHLDSPIHSIETSLPRGSIPTSYTAYRERYGDPPADYSEVYTYGDRVAFQRRFGPQVKRGRQNLVVFELDPHLTALHEAPVAQVFVDLWNTDTWYARRFLEALGKKIRDLVPGGVP